MVTIADCERVQTNWFRLQAEACGGDVWTDGPLTWIDGNLLFPYEMSTPAVLRGLSRARERKVPVVGAWLSLDVDPSPLAEAGFTRGWSPWWMTADLSALAGAPDPRGLAGVPDPRALAGTRGPRVELQTETVDYRSEDPGYADLLAVARVRPTRAWYAAAYTADRHRFAGRAWSFLDGDLAGVFDMQVWPPFRRRGFGTALLNTVCHAARQAGARHAVLNATPEGKLLYETAGFTQIGSGITWWHHG